MSIVIDSAETEALLADLAAQTRRSPPDLLLDLLRRERERLETDRERRIAEGRAIDEDLRRRWEALAHIDPRPAGEMLAFGEDGLPR
jgi:hypothetical protein